MTLTYHIVVYGMVQGVGMRLQIRTRAKSLGITGWVRNTPNGSVEGEMQADPDTLHDFLRWLQDSPGSSRVDKVEYTKVDRPAFELFSIRY